MNLTKTAGKKLGKLLDGAELDQVSNWPDEIKSDEHMARPQSRWHYVNIKGGKYKPLDPKTTYEVFFKKYPKLSYEEIQKKHRPDTSETKGDLVWAIEKFRSILKNKKNTKAQRAEAVKFLAHFIADLHQPLHCGYAHDRGGNDVKVDWWGKETNLHAVWDSSMVDMQKLSFTEYVKYIHKNDKKKTKNYRQGQLMDWIKESMAQRDSLYELTTNKRYEGKYKEYRYHYDFSGLLNENLIKGGIRLAKVLNEDL